MFSAQQVSEVSHWLRIKFNSLLIDYKTPHDPDPAYLSDLTFHSSLVFNTRDSSIPVSQIHQAIFSLKPYTHSSLCLKFSASTFCKNKFVLCTSDLWVMSNLQKFTPSKHSLHLSGNYLPQYPKVFSPSLSAIILFIHSFVCFFVFPLL